MDLSQLRKEIDSVDAQLIELFRQRMEIAASIAAYKKEHNLPILVPEREQEKLQAVAAQSVPELADYTVRLFESLMALSREYQEKKLEVKCGLLGRHLSHSYSPAIHSFFGDYPYDLFEKEPEELENFLKNGDFTGLNVTIPYKKAVIPYLDELTPTARKLGAVNTILRRPDGSLLGHNSDPAGFRYLLTKSGLDVSRKKVLVLGSGGASRTAVSVLEESGALVTVISRSGEDNYENLSRHYDARVIVNTTPVGMYPNTGHEPLEPEHFPDLEGILDLIYNPERTQLMLDAENLMVPAWSGLWMLIAQAKESAEYFLGKQLPDTLLEEIHRSLTARMRNIVLIGMPGCGKSTIGRLLAEKTGRAFADSDEKIRELAGKSPEEVLNQDGEEVFRDWETRALIAQGKESGLVIATGGGCVTQLRNYPFLHQNGTIFWLQRELDKLPTDGRPLSRGNGLKALFAKRKILYQAFSDYEISNDGTPEETVSSILSRL